MARVIEESNLSYEQRDQAQAEILAMEQSNLREQGIFEQQMKSLKEELNNNLSTKSTSTFSSKKLNHLENNGAEELSCEESHFSIASSNNEIFISETAEEEKLQHLQEVFSRIYSAIESSSLSDENGMNKNACEDDEKHNYIIDTFLTNEEQNFSLLTFANEQADQINRLQGQVQALREEEASYEKKNGNDKNQYKIHLIELENKINCLNQQKKKYMDKCMDNRETLDQLRSILHVSKKQLNIEHSLLILKSIFYRIR